MAQVNDKLCPEDAMADMAKKLGIPLSMLPQDVKNAIAHICTAPKKE
jgi:hypothetical protein